MLRARRCRAHSRRSGKPCQAPAVKGRTRCRMHGGAKGSGAPTGPRNGAWRGGSHTDATRAFTREISSLLRASRAAIEELG
ncbi:MAG: HGGxSTG domain-containing protein [Caulobacteraceae bacterium]